MRNTKITRSLGLARSAWRRNYSPLFLACIVVLCALVAAAAAATVTSHLQGVIQIEAKAGLSILLIYGATASFALVLLILLQKHRSRIRVHAAREQITFQQKQQLRAAIANMPQGICMYDGNQQLIVCNQKYAEMYDLRPEHTNPGTSFKTIVQHRVAIGNAPSDDDYVRNRLRSVSEPKPYEMINRLRDGRLISVSHQPIDGGGWVSTHTDVTEQTNREESFRLLFEANPVPMWVIDRDTLQFIAVNDAAVALYGYTREQFVSMTVLELRPKEERENFAQFLRALDDIQFIENVGQHFVASGEAIDVSVSSRVMNYSGRRGRLAAIHDITNLKRTENQLRSTEKFLDAVIEHVPAPILVKDVTAANGNAATCHYSLINKAFEELFGVPRTQIVGKSVHELYPKERADFIIAENNEALNSEKPIVLSDHAVQTATNGVRICTATTVAVRDDLKLPQYLVTVLQDVTERNRDEQRIARMARYDHLTDLPNRAAFNDAIDEAINAASRKSGQFTLLSVDLDGFKEANDTYGHLVGDALLCEVARRLIAASGGAFAARIGGDEFALIVEGDTSQANAVAEKVLASNKRDVRIDERNIRVGATIGAAVYPKDGLDAKTLMSNADVALYRAKSETRGGVLFFDADLGDEVRERRALQDALRCALERNEMLLHYQPQKTISGESVGFEALVRWQCSHLGTVPPSAFIPIAEELGLIDEIGEWVLREACREAASWPTPLRIAVNVSPIQFRNVAFPGVVHAILLETGLSPSRLELEITEGVFIDDFSRAVSILSRLKALGVRVALDDFGSGYSSLAYLHSFAFDKIKIDRTFISDLDDNHHSMAIVRAVIDLGHSLNIPVLAEGVETQLQHTMLLGRGCDEVQGYLIGRPLPIEMYSELVGRNSASERNRALLTGH